MVPESPPVPRSVLRLAPDRVRSFPLQRAQVRERPPVQFQAQVQVHAQRQCQARLPLEPSPPTHPTGPPLRSRPQAWPRLSPQQPAPARMQPLLAGLLRRRAPALVQTALVVLRIPLVLKALILRMRRV